LRCSWRRSDPALPGHQLGGHRALLQHADPVHVLQIVDGVRDVVRGVHHAGLDGLLPVGDPAGERLPGGPQVAQLGGVRTELRRAALRVVRRRGGTARLRVHEARPVVPGPRVFQDCGPHRVGEVEADGGLAADLGAGDDAVRLGVALEAVRQSQPLPGQLVEHPLAEVAERRVAEVVGQGGGLDDVRIAPTQLLGQIGFVRRAGDAFRDRPGHLGDLEAVRHAVVHQQAGAARADHLGDAGQPGEEG
jgi:hypothetical protein